LITTSSSWKSLASLRIFAPTLAAEPTKALLRIGASIASSASEKPRSAMASGDCSGPERAALPIDAPAIARQRQVGGLLVAVGRQRPDAERRLRQRMALARLKRWR
jgi:hypothetical protein